MITMNIKILAVGFCVMSFCVACKKNADDGAIVPQDNSSLVLQQSVLKNIGEHLIVESYKDFTLKSISLNEACDAFVDAPSLTTLATAQYAWKNAKKSWKRCEVFSFGPAESLLISGSIDYLNISTTGIENNITTTDPITNAYVESIPSNTKGLGTLEYLLFDRNDDNNIITHFTVDPDVANRKVYLTALCENLEAQANVIYKEWDPAQKNYVKTFKNNTGTKVSSSLSLLINSMIKSCDLIKTTKIGIPLGKSTGTIDPLSVESYYSKYSVNAIKETIVCYQNILTGQGYGSMDGKGINVLLKDKDFKENIYNKAITSIDKNVTNADLITTPLDEAVQNNDAHALALYDSSNELLIILKNELSSVLNILVTFTDSDGD